MARFTSSLLALAGMALSVRAQGDFSISGITAQQPNGAKDGQTDYYNMAFAVSSTLNGGQSGYCEATWGDNVYTSQNAYSDSVPTGSWMQCDSSKANFGDGNSEFTFRLFPYFSIGNWTFQVQQTYVNGSSQAVATSDEFKVSNTTTSYNYSCTINPQEVSSVQVHASGDCSLAANETLSVAIQSTTGGSCAAAAVSFPVIATTVYGESVVVAGNITQLGNWSPADAFALNAAQYTGQNHEWNGTVSIPVGTSFEYKYIIIGTDGSINWETTDNRVATVPESACGGAVQAGDHNGAPDDFDGTGTSTA